MRVNFKHGNQKDLVRRSKSSVTRLFSAPEPKSFIMFPVFAVVNSTMLKLWVYVLTHALRKWSVIKSNSNLAFVSGQNSNSISWWLILKKVSIVSLRTTPSILQNCLALNNLKKFHLSLLVATSSYWLCTATVTPKEIRLCVQPTSQERSIDKPPIRPVLPKSTGVVTRAWCWLWKTSLRL